MRRSLVIAGAILALAACSSSDNVTGIGPITAPTNLTYQLLPSGDPDVPEGIELRWDPVNDPNVADYAVFSRASDADPWSLRAQTTSPSFEDLGVPDAEYYVASQAADGSLSAASNTVVVDNTNKLEPPDGLFAIALDHAVQLGWSSNARTSNPDAFSYYRVYSAAYDAGQNLCDSVWVLEGTTVSEDFIASGLPNGQGRCFDVSAISFDGHESDWPTPVAATPTAGSGDVVLFAAQDSAARSGLLFSSSLAAPGKVAAGGRRDIDVRLDRRADGTLWLTPVRSGATVAALANGPVADVSSLAAATAGTQPLRAIQATRGFGYVFQTTSNDSRPAALRVAAVGSNYVIVDRQEPSPSIRARLTSGRQELGEALR